MIEGGGFRDHEGRLIDFGRTVADYERYRPGFPESFFDHLVDLGWIGTGLRCLDLGTGTGSIALGFQARGLEAIGIDIAPEMLRVAGRRAADRGLSVRFLEGRAESTGLDEAGFDIVSAGQCWWWFDSEATIREVQRILAPGGRLIICNFSYLPLPGSVAQRTEELILRHNPGWSMAGGQRIHPEQVEALDDGGFQDVMSFSYIVDVPFSHEAWRGRIRTCNGVGSALSDEQVEGFDTDLVELLAQRFPGELNVPHRIFATSGIKP